LNARTIIKARDQHHAESYEKYDISCHDLTIGLRDLTATPTGAVGLH
jgi:hypothetical protein